ncbi:MAG: hypothetical protein APF81_13855 [Desulfosporosinus sp. BRH_c37]|nr:MAG: hypothetical protein APF81_13855 [Desulfosporosinus sp. BRH_c37]
MIQGYDSARCGQQAVTGVVLQQIRGESKCPGGLNGFRRARKNILNASYSYIGIGITDSSTGKVFNQMFVKK